MLSLPAALAPLGQFRQFITYLVVPSPTRPGKTDKFPTDYRTGEVVDAHDPSRWTDFETAQASGRPVGFVFTDNDPFFFLDIDGALQPDGQWSPIAHQLCQVFAGCAVERSQSGNGLHIFGMGWPADHAKKNRHLNIEFYHSGRFVALTGIDATGSAATVADPRALPWLINTYFVPAAEVADADLTQGPRGGWNGPKDDATLIARACRSQSSKAAFGSGASFNDLWLGDVDVLSKAYPSSTGDAFDRSSADAALFQHLAFWTGADGERMVRLARMSALAREKWDRHSSYLRLTAGSACGRQTEVLRDKPPAQLPSPTGDTVDQAQPKQVAVAGATFLGAEEQAQMFAGCVYVSDQHAVLVPGGELMPPDRFKVQYGGFTFAMDAANERTTRNAWEAFTESQCLRPPKVATTTFRPELTPAAIVVSGGRRKVNVWWPIEVPRAAAGSVEPFTRHLAKLLPDERDAKIMLSYMAACVQHKGVKFQWAPLLQGVEGNGKSFLSECVINAVGERYTHSPRADQISAQFNPWVRNKLVIAVEDVFVLDQKQETFEILKPMITAKRLPVEAKGVDQVMAEVCCNWILNSNHKDGLRKTRNDRRIAPLFCAQQHEADLARDGLTGEYFESLVSWYTHGGMAVVNEFLATYPIEHEFNPATGQRAPKTTSTEAAIDASRGVVEQHVQEAIEQQTTGFCGDWVSSIALDRLLSRLGLERKVPPNKRRDLMHGLGYDLHPALPGGRVNNLILPDGGKPKLFVRIGSAAAALSHAGEVAKAYTSAQTV